MKMFRLHSDTIEEIKQRVDIIDVVSDYVVLKKRGQNFVGLCPFHQEKTGSFTVNPSKQMYYCFGCATGGDGIKFLMEIGKQSFQEVVLDLAKRYQVPIKTLETRQVQEITRQLSLRGQMYEILALTASFYQHILQQEQGQSALDYLKRERKLSPETIQSFGLGYAPGGWETLYRYLIDGKRYPVTIVEQAGLIKPRKSGGGYYDQFRDRLMIPIKDAQGRVIAFGGRSFDGEEPKYLNSPETPLFDKGKTLFALDKAKAGISQQDKAIVVEGYFDAIALHSVGITNVVASLGTALSSEQLKQLLRYTQSKQIILNFDADKAGLAASHRAIKEVESLIYTGQVQLKILQLPQGKDADEFLKSSEQAVEEYQKSVAVALLWMDWQIEQLIKDKNLGQAEHFQHVSQQMIQYISKLESSDLRTYYIEKCATILANGKVKLIGSYFQNFQSQLKRLDLPSRSTPSIITQIITGEESLLQEAESLLLLFYLHFPDYRQKIKDCLEEKNLIFGLAPHRILWQTILENELLDNQQNLVNTLPDCYSDKETQFKEISRLFSLPNNFQEDSERIYLLIKQAIASLEKVHLEKKCQSLLKQWQQTHSQEYIQTYYKAREQIHHLDQVRLSDVQ